MSKVLLSDLLGSASKRGQMGVSGFFTDTNSKGYMSCSDFLNYIESVSTERKLVEGLSTLFELTGQRAVISSMRIVKKDQKERRYYWMVMTQNNSKVEFKLILTDGLISFINDYCLGTIRPNLSLDALYDHVNTENQLS